MINYLHPNVFNETFEGGIFSKICLKVGVQKLCN